ncbi:hypothetical protein [Pelosinus fermentans]|uniref:hypothetical protein n=1 Tax=Pelosinus fermentans TaxID=365349 RepID=UPI00130E27AD|nr:hypothetical protein [Pelosinus fermentans]
MIIIIIITINIMVVGPDTSVGPDSPAGLEGIVGLGKLVGLDKVVVHVSVYNYLLYRKPSGFFFYSSRPLLHSNNKYLSFWYINHF